MRYLKVTTYDNETEELVVVYVQTDRDDERVIALLQEVHPEWEGINLTPVKKFLTSWAPCARLYSESGGNDAVQVR